MTILTRDEIIGIARQAKSLMHRDELAWLCNLAELAPDGNGAEIGVYCGASLIAWSLVRYGRGLSYGVDDWSYQNEYIDKYIDKGNEHNSLRVDGLRSICEENLTRAQVTAQLFDGKSIEQAALVPNDLAFVFIDGDHTSPAIDNDIATWTPKLMTGGVLAFHDYGRRKNGCRVTQTVDAWQAEAQAQWHLIGKVETTIGYRKQ